MNRWEVKLSIRPGPVVGAAGRTGWWTSRERVIERGILCCMSKTYRCPVCANEVDVAATICSSAACRAELAFCSHCRDITTYVLVEERRGRTARNLYRCDRCQRLGVKCYTWLSGAYCNGLARAGESVDMPLCSGCSGRVAEVSRNVIGWTLIGALGGLLNRKGG